MSIEGGVGLPRGHRRVWWLVLAVAGALLLLRCLLVPGPDAAAGSLSIPGALDVVVPLGVALVMSHASWRLRRRSRRLAAAWGALGLAYFSYAAAEAVGSILGSALGTSSAGSWAGLGLYLLFYPLYLVGILGLPASPLASGERVPLVLDMAIVLLGMTLVLFTLLIRPALALGPRPPLRLVLTVAAPAGDLVVLWVLLTLLLRGRDGRVSLPAGLLTASAACLLVADVLYSYHLVWGRPRLWQLLGPAWVAAHLLAGLAAVRQLLDGDVPVPAPRVSGRRPGRASLYLAYSCLVGAIAVLARGGENGSRTLATVIVLAIVALVLARKMLGMRESDRLRAELVRARDTLEERVKERTAALERANRTLEAEVEERKKAEARIERELRRLAALRAIDQAITGSFDLEVTLGVFLENAVSQLGVDAGAVHLLDPVSQTLEMRARRGLGVGTRRIERMPIGEGRAGLAALERRTVSGADVFLAAARTPEDRLARENGFRTGWATPLVARGQVKGVLEVWSRALLEPDEDWLGFLGTLAGQGAIAVDNTTLFERTQRSNVELARAYDSTLRGWALALELRDHETQGHSVRVTDAAVRLARAFEMDEDELVHVRRGALLHDIGKIAIPDSILLKGGPLTDSEWSVMRRHPVHAFELLSHVAYLRPALDIPYCHHERWDGTGYPRGLGGAGIPLAARLFAVVDNWDALSFDRPYRGAWPAARIRSHLLEHAGTLFDPEAVRAFLEVCC